MSREYVEDRECVECGRETPHDVYDAEHERDSSNNSAFCKVCGTMTDGWGDSTTSPHPSYRKAHGIPEP